MYVLKSLSSCYFQWRWSQSREQHSRPDSQGLICLTKHRCQSRRAEFFLTSHVVSASLMPKLNSELISDINPPPHLFFSNKMLQTRGAWRMLWLNPRWKHFRYNIDATQISSDSYSPALPAAPWPWHATRCVSRLGFWPAVGLPVQVKSHGGWWRNLSSSLGSLHCTWPCHRQRCLRAPLNWGFQSEKGVLCEQWSHHSNSDSFWKHTLPLDSFHSIQRWCNTQKSRRPLINVGCLLLLGGKAP